MPNKGIITDWFKSLQDNICSSLEKLDGLRFEEDLWVREGGGGGRTRVLKGQHIEKGGVNFSAVEGAVTDQMRRVLKTQGEEFYATGVSIVLHPKNPFVPIIHMNVRYFEMDVDTWWFGGGIDLTPHFIDPKEARFFHEQMKAACDVFSDKAYPRFKTWADDYFYLPHRSETRGIGGIFFDHLNTEKEGLSKDHIFSFVQRVGESFIPTYNPLFSANYEKEFTSDQKLWQRIRRGRYAEFNLAWDRGTKFGLHSNGRTESILMSLPPEVEWAYNFDYQAIDGAAYTQSKLIKGLDWLNYKLEK